jgi:hypothetical protein
MRHDYLPGLLGNVDMSKGRTQNLLYRHGEPNEPTKQGVTKRCHLSRLSNSALVYEPKCRGRGGRCGVSANEYSCTQELK